MSELEHAIQWELGKPCMNLSQKYKIMLKRNNSIVKDTLSKIWKLCSIMRGNCVHWDERPAEQVDEKEEEKFQTCKASL